MKGCTLLPLLAVVVGIGYVVKGSPAAERTVDQKIVQLLTRLSERKTTDVAVNEVRKAGAVIADQMKKDGQREQLVGRKEDADSVHNIAELKRKPVPNMLANHDNQLKRNKDGNKDENSLGNSEEQFLLREIINILGNKRQEHAHSQETLEIQEGPAGAEFVMKDGVFELTVDSGVALKVACKTVMFDGDDLFSSVLWLATGETTTTGISFGPHLLTADTNKYTIDQVETETGSDYVLGLYNLDQTDEKLYSCQADGTVAMRLYVTDVNNDEDKVTITQAGGAGAIKTIKLLTVDSGDSIALQCNVIFDDDLLPGQIPAVLWIARGTTILYDDHMLSPDLRYTVQYTGNENIVSSVLRIQRVTSEDEGEYGCQVLEFDNSVHGTSIVIAVRGNYEKQLKKNNALPDDDNLEKKKQWYAPGQSGQYTAFPSDYRVDGKCGPNYPGPNGEEGICIGNYPCCSTFGRCGNSVEHCEIFLYRDFSTDLPSNYRVDGRCGPDYQGPNGEEGICLANGTYPCCSTGGWCGNTLEHCETYLYRDFRTDLQTDLPSNYRVDGRCGPDYPGSNGDEGICLGSWIYPCCSTGGWCGNSAEHCETYLYRDFRTPGHVIRLVGGSNDNEGRVEVLHHGEWGTVCYDGWDAGVATVVCRELGLPYVYAQHVVNGQFGPGEGRIWLDDVNCTGEEIQLSQCLFGRWGSHNCIHDFDVGVICTDIHTDSYFQMRLADGGYNANEGRVEIFENGAWGTVCDDGWGVEDATVVCRQLGLPYGDVQATSSAHFGQGEGEILLDDVFCTGDESQLSQCTHEEFGVHNCGHHEDAGVICGGN